MDLSQELQRGAQAQSILDSEVYKDCVSQVRNAIITAWENSPVRDTEGQHELRLMLKLFNDLQTNIKTVADTGKLAKLHVESESKMRGALRAVGFK
jgi:hypothetical protein